MQKEITPRFSEASLLQEESTRHIFAEAAISALNAAAVEPARAIAQVTDKISGGSHAKDIATAAQSAGMETRPADFGSANWFAQQLGSAAGMMAPYLLARSAVRFGLNKTVGESVLSPAHNLYRGTSAGNLTRAAGSEAAVTGASGFVYGLSFVPSNQTGDSSNAGFVMDRLKNAMFDGIAFGAIGAMSPIMGAGLNKLAHKVDQFNTEALTGATRAYERNMPLHNFLPKAQDQIVAALRGPVIAGALSGVPIGAVNAEVGALKKGQLLPDSNDLKENIVSMMFVGSALAKVNHLVDTPQRNAVKAERDSWTSLVVGNDPINRAPERPTPYIDVQYVRDLGGPRDFTNWVFKNQEALNSGKHKYMQSRMPELAKLWTELPPQARSNSVDTMPSILESWAHMTPRQQSLQNSDLAAHAKVIANFPASDRSKIALTLETNPTFVDTYAGIISRQKAPLMYADGEAVLANWKDLPARLKAATDREIMIIGSSWDKLTHSQKQLSPAELLKTSTIVHDLGLRARDAALVEQSKGFVEWYERHTNFRNPEYPTGRSHFNKFDMSGLMFQNQATIQTALRNWSELTPQLKSIDLQSLRPIMRSWADFTPTQKKLGVSELTEIAKIQKSLNLDKAGMEKLESAPDFPSWFNKHQEEYGRPEYRIANTRELLPTWVELPLAERKNLTLRQAMDVAERWTSIKESQHGKPLESILETVSIANELRLDWQQAKILSENPSFYGWYSRALRPQGPFKAGPELKELHALLERWPQFPPETQNLSLGSVRSISDIWPNLTPELRSRSALEIRNIAAVKRDLNLSASDALNIFQIDALRNRVREASKEAYMTAKADLSPVKQELQLVLDAWKRLPADKRPQFDQWLDNNLGDRSQVSLEKLQLLAGTIRTIDRHTQFQQGAQSK